MKRQGAVAEPRRGWAEIGFDRYHYIVGTDSLCRLVAWDGGRGDHSRFLDDSPGVDDEPTNCKLCRRLFRRKEN